MSDMTSALVEAICGSDGRREREAILALASTVNVLVGVAVQNGWFTMEEFNRLRLLSVAAIDQHQERKKREEEERLLAEATPGERMLYDILMRRTCPA